MALTAELLGDRWTLLILREAFYGVQRYDDMLMDLSAPRAMLTDRLAKLVTLNILEKHSYQEQGSRARNAYRLTGSGRALGKVLMAMSDWGEQFVTKTPAPVHIVDAVTGKPAGLEFVNDKGVAINSANIRLVLKPKRSV
jgi:DNA-binding HxlR family transcriptional regulator